MLLLASESVKVWSSHQDWADVVFLKTWVRLWAVGVATTILSPDDVIILSVGRTHMLPWSKHGNPNSLTLTLTLTTSAECYNQSEPSAGFRLAQTLAVEEPDGGVIMDHWNRKSYRRWKQMDSIFCFWPWFIMDDVFTVDNYCRNAVTLHCAPAPSDLHVILAGKRQVVCIIP